MCPDVHAQKKRKKKKTYKHASSFAVSWSNRRDMNRQTLFPRRIFFSFFSSVPQIFPFFSKPEEREEKLVSYANFEIGSQDFRVYVPSYMPFFRDVNEVYYERSRQSSRILIMTRESMENRRKKLVGSVGRL